jgi:hypothetical protein
MSITKGKGEHMSTKRYLLVRRWGLEIVKLAAALLRRLGRCNGVPPSIAMSIAWPGAKCK